MCNDNGSAVEEYAWAIGTTVGGFDIQNFTSTGVNPTGINDNLEGILQHNTTYFVTIRCTNQANLTTTWEDKGGVTVLLEPPDVDSVNASIVGAEQFDHPVEPASAMKSENPTTIGGSWTVSPDPSIKRYDFCVGSSMETIEDVFPCMWVGYNMSGEVTIADGNLTINGQLIYRISEIKPSNMSSNGTKQKLSENNVFRMEPGRTLFTTMRMCNEAMLCKNKFLGSVVITNDNTLLETSDDGRPIEIEMQEVPRNRTKRSISATVFRTSGGLLKGQSLMVTVLNEDDLNVQYRSDASVDFVSYLANPNYTMDMVQRSLYKRLRKIGLTFAVVPVGHLPLPGPLYITFGAESTNTSDDEGLMLIHWNPDEQQWQISNRTCRNETNTTVYDATEGTSTVKVCNTRQSPSVESDDISYLSTETEFGVALVGTAMINLPPSANNFTWICMKEDSGTLVYFIDATDPEDDNVVFHLIPARDIEGHVTLSLSGLLRFKPCRDCFGNVSLGISIKDVPADIDVKPAITNITVRIEVQEQNDAPAVFMYDIRNNSILQADPTEPVMIYREQCSGNGSITFETLVGAFDVDKAENLSFVLKPDFIANNGTFQLQNQSGKVPSMFFRCTHNKTCNGHQLHHSPLDLTWLSASLIYQQTTPYVGIDEVALVVTDKDGVPSDAVTLRVVLMELPCKNNGTCRSKDATYTCTDVLRTKGFDKYYECVCSPGWSGLHCENNLDECASNPCEKPYECMDMINAYKCTCPEENPRCDEDNDASESGLKPWAYALIGLACALLLAILAVLYLTGRLRYLKAKLFHQGLYQLWHSRVSVAPESDSRVSLKLSDDEESTTDDNDDNAVDIFDKIEAKIPPSLVSVKNVHFKSAKVAPSVEDESTVMDANSAPGFARPPHHSRLPPLVKPPLPSGFLLTAPGSTKPPHHPKKALP